MSLCNALSFARRIPASLTASPAPPIHPTFLSFSLELGQRVPFRCRLHFLFCALFPSKSGPTHKTISDSISVRGLCLWAITAEILRSVGFLRVSPVDDCRKRHRLSGDLAPSPLSRRRLRHKASIIVILLFVVCATPSFLCPQLAPSSGVGFAA
jgi:hypothetical protein